MDILMDDTVGFIWWLIQGWHC